MINLVDSSEVGKLIDLADKSAKEYNWTAAADYLSRTLESLRGEVSDREAGIWERFGYSLLRAAMQSETSSNFQTGLEKAVASYQKAWHLYASVPQAVKLADAQRCEALDAFLRAWLTIQADEKRRLLALSWRLAKESLETFRSHGDASNFFKTFSSLWMSALLHFTLEWNFQTREKVVGEALEAGEHAIEFLTPSGEDQSLAQAYAITATILSVATDYTRDQEGKAKHSQKAFTYLQKGLELSEEATLLQSVALPLAGVEFLRSGSNEALSNLKQALNYARKSRDRLTTGSALDHLAYHTFWKCFQSEDPELRMRLLTEALGYAEEAKQQYAPLSFVNPRAGVLWSEAPHGEYYWALGLWETDLKKRANLLGKALEAAEEGSKRAEECGFPEIIETAQHVVSKILSLLSKTTSDRDTKRRILEKAMDHRNEYIQIVEKLHPYDYFNRAVGMHSLADIKFELSQLADEKATRQNLLEEAVSDEKESVKFCSEEISQYEQAGSVYQQGWLGERRYTYGNWTHLLYELTKENVHLTESTQSFHEAAKSFQKAGLVSRMAEAYWRAAQIQDALGEHAKASEDFHSASIAYETASERISSLRSFYSDHARYMEAWDSIEKARFHHAKQEYASSGENYQRAASLHESTKHWRYLAPNYSALAVFEEAEDLSRKDESAEAMKAFAKAAKLFVEGKHVMKKEVESVSSSEEHQMALELIKVADQREEYCLGRERLEEALLLDRTGQRGELERYDEALNTFQGLAERVDSEGDRREFRHMSTLCNAWKTMAQAEQEVTPGLYLDASKLFEAAKELSTSRESKLLEMGHSRICMALEAGMKFLDSQNMSYHATAMQAIESAAEYYLKAGFSNASEYAEATSLLFDAYANVSLAKQEADQARRTASYAAAEKLLTASAEAFLKAGHPSRREQVLRLLERVGRERELSLSLAEILSAPSMVTTSALLSAPTPSRERAVGLQRFEHADVQARLLTSKGELKIGENFELDVELVNAGRGPAQLVKIDEVIPAGFRLEQKPKGCRLMGHDLDLRGKRLDPLKTEVVRITLQAKEHGLITLNPSVLYLDENNEQKSYELEPVEVRVRELGISGWLKGGR